MKTIAFLIAVLMSFARVAAFAAEPQKETSSSLPEAKTTARILLVTGMDYPGHHWRETGPVLAAALRKDPRLEVRRIEDPNFLESAALGNYDAVILHFQTWEPPSPGERARENLRQFVAGGKGVVLVHFACGAWHNEWPEFEKIAGRVWFGQDPGPGKQQHDPYGRFTVELAQPLHPIVKGMQNFRTQDELYTCLIGERPIEVLATAQSNKDGKSYPMAFISRYEQGRTFHCPLGHDVKALSGEGVQELFRRGTAWAAGLAPVPEK